MPQSLSHVLVHVIFSTKDRRPFLDETIRSGAHAYLATVCRDQGCHAYRVGGTEDHVHAVTTLSRTISISKLVEKIKKTSSVWVKQQGASYGAFYWQRGYGAFSVSPTHLDNVIAYIDRQPQHHRRAGFQDEFRQFLERYGVEYDERYVWD